MTATGELQWWRDNSYLLRLERDKAREERDLLRAHSSSPESPGWWAAEADRLRAEADRLGEERDLARSVAVTLEAEIAATGEAVRLLRRAFDLDPRGDWQDGAAWTAWNVDTEAFLRRDWCLERGHDGGCRECVNTALPL